MEVIQKESECSAQLASIVGEGAELEKRDIYSGISLICEHRLVRQGVILFHLAATHLFDILYFTQEEWSLLDFESLLSFLWNLCQGPEIIW